MTRQTSVRQCAWKPACQAQGRCVAWGAALQ